MSATSLATSAARSLTSRCNQQIGLSSKSHVLPQASELLSSLALISESLPKRPRNEWESVIYLPKAPSHLWGGFVSILHVDTPASRASLLL